MSSFYSTPLHRRKNGKSNMKKNSDRSDIELHIKRDDNEVNGVQEISDTCEGIVGSNCVACEDETLISMTQVGRDQGANKDSDSKVGNKGRKMAKAKELKDEAFAALGQMQSGCNQYWGDVCSVDFLKRKLPIIQWLPKYSTKSFTRDMIAGLTVGLTVIPQGLAYAALAGLDLQVRL